MARPVTPQTSNLLRSAKCSASGFVPYQLGHVTLIQFNLHFRFEAKRVIIRQGHKAENFYFILSGTGEDKHAYC